ANGIRIVGVGTLQARAIEFAAHEHGAVQVGSLDISTKEIALTRGVACEELLDTHRLRLDEEPHVVPLRDSATLKRRPTLAVTPLVEHALEARRMGVNAPISLVHTLVRRAVYGTSWQGGVSETLRAVKKSSGPGRRAAPGTGWLAPIAANSAVVVSAPPT